MADSPRPPTSAPDLQPTIDRLKAIAAKSQNSLLLADCPPHPDAELLDLCGEILHRLVHAEKARRERLEIPYSTTGTADQRRNLALDRALMEDRQRLDGEAAPLLRRARKLRATTPAGIYAKALCVRASRTGAALLAKSLAEELLACPPLRMSLWPAAPDAPAEDAS